MPGTAPTVETGPLGFATFRSDIRNGAVLRMADDVGDEVPEADALEQRQDMEDHDAAGDVPADDSMEVPEADALEQAQDARLDDDEPDRA